MKSFLRMSVTTRVGLKLSIEYSNIRLLINHSIFNLNILHVCNAVLSSCVVLCCRSICWSVVKEKIPAVHSVKLLVNQNNKLV